jgi:hypothetical protein
MRERQRGQHRGGAPHLVGLGASRAQQLRHLVETRLDQGAERRPGIAAGAGIDAPERTRRIPVDE